jgi:hypothetical protein
MLGLNTAGATRATCPSSIRNVSRSHALIMSLMVLVAAGGCLSQNLESKRGGAGSLRFLGLTNGTVLQGQVNLPVNVRPCDFDGIYFVVNEGPSPMGVAVETNNTGYGIVRWLTENFENGLYDVYLEADVGERRFYSPTNSLIVSNLISFDSWPVCGTQMWVFARLAVPHADWNVKVFDERTNYIGNFVGTTTNGLINFIWDLQSTTGTRFTNENSFSLDYSFEAVGDSKPIIPLVHPDPMVAPSVYTDARPNVAFEMKNLLPQANPR